MPYWRSQRVSPQSYLLLLGWDFFFFFFFFFGHFRLTLPLLPSSCLSPRWIEACIGEEIDAITTLEEGLRNGVVLAKLARFFDPPSVKRIFEVCILRTRMANCQQIASYFAMDKGAFHFFSDISVSFADS